MKNENEITTRELHKHIRKKAGIRRRIFKKGKTLCFRAGEMKTIVYKIAGPNTPVDDVVCSKLFSTFIPGWNKQTTIDTHPDKINLELILKKLSPAPASSRTATPISASPADCVLDASLTMAAVDNKSIKGVLKRTGWSVGEAAKVPFLELFNSILDRPNKIQEIRVNADASYSVFYFEGKQ